MIGADMIEVAVRIDNHLELQADGGNVRENSLSLLPWIDDQRLFARFMEALKESRRHQARRVIENHAPLMPPNDS